MHRVIAQSEQRNSVQIGAVNASLTTHESQIASPANLGHVKVGPTLVIGPDGTLDAPTASGDKTYRHTQITAATVWVVSHNLGKFVTFMSFDATGDQIYGSVSNVTDHTLTLTFSSAISGEVICS